MTFENEPDRPELREGPAWVFALDRREFLEAAGLVILIGAAAPLEGQDAPPRARLTVDEQGNVTVYTGKVEVGQGARTEIAMAVAEELHIAPSRVRVVLGDTDLCPNDGITAGSRTTPSTVPAVRQAAAGHRGAPVTPPAEWQVLGRSLGRTDARAIVTGAHQYPSDIRRPGMLYGAVLRPPAYGARLTAVDAAAAAKRPGVTVVNDNGFAGCAAPTSFAARKAVAALEAAARWETGEHPPVERLYEELRATAGRPREQSRGSLAAGLAAARHRLRAEYRTAFIQHAPMEPRAAVAEWNDGKLTVWTGTQNPFGVRQQLQQAFHLPADRVRVIVPDTGGGFGGKHTGETAIEVARLAQAAGKPVSLRWTRAEEFTWAYFRPAGLFDIEAGIDSDGRIASWDFTCLNAGAAGLESPYRAANSRTRLLSCNSPLREGSYRGIAATANNFARECFVDELAAAAGVDPLEFRLANLDNARLRDALIAVAEKSGWKRRRSQPRAKGTGIGLACGTEKGSYVAAAVEVEVGAAGKIVIRQFHMAFECGAILNPSNLRAQVEGSIIQGLGGALTEEILYTGGRLLNGSFARYKVPRFLDVPPLEITLLDRRDMAPAGAGETPIIAVAPAIAAAVFDATGERPRTMPIRPGPRSGSSG